MKKMFCKNWPEIKRIKDKTFRTAVCLATDKEVLRGLKKGFPNLFCREAKPPQGIPLSALRLYMEEHLEEICGKEEWYQRGEQKDRENFLKEECGAAMIFFGIEYVVFFGKKDEESESKRIPREIDEQLSHRRPTDYKIGHKLTWKGEPYILVGIRLGYDGDFLCLDSVTIAKASYIDVTA
jgi:hypothetical protein